MEGGGQSGADGEGGRGRLSGSWPSGALRGAGEGRQNNATTSWVPCETITVKRSPCSLLCSRTEEDE